MAKPNKLSAALGFKTELALLPHQLELMTDVKTRIVGLVSGYGGGKTFTIVRKALQLALLNPGTDSIITEPNHPLLTQILLPEMHTALREFQIPYTYKAGEKIFYLNVNGQENRIICASAENYERLIGVNASAVLMDEFDTSKPSIAYEAFIKLLGRLRAGTVRQMILVSTPEGFGAMHRIFVEEKAQHKAHLIHAKTTDNFFLPQDFIDTMMSSYSDKQRAAYINGEFINMKSGSVYTDFDRHNNHASIEIDKDDPVSIGIDFNVGGSVLTMALYQDDSVYFFDEYVARNTREMAEYIVSRFGTDVILYPDTSGANNTTNSSESDHDILVSYGLIIDAPKANPRINDRVTAMNSGFYHKKIWIDTKRCPELTTALEQHAYDGDKPEKFDKHPSIDDYNDSAGYLVNRLLPIIKPTLVNQNKYQ